ncbi:MAG: CRTAC1 family protein [Acidimicrobiia bacterium]
MKTPDWRSIGWFSVGVATGSLLALTLILGVDLFSESDGPASDEAVSWSLEPATAMGPPHFSEEAAAAGINHIYDGEFTFFVGGGVAVFDCDDDGRPDLYFAGGTNPASLYHNESNIGGALQFTELPDPNTDLTEVTGAYPLDIDADGRIDLAVLRVGANVLLRGIGGCRFERANDALPFDGGDAWTVGFSATWEGTAEFPTLAFGNYIALDKAGDPTYTCEDNVLMRPQGDGGYPVATALAPGWCTLSALFSDWNRSGDADLRMANDRQYYRDGEEQLWHITRGEAPRLYTQDEGWLPLQIWGMGIASQDLNGDGRPEVLIASMADNKLQALDENAAGPSYHDIAIRRGVTAHRPFTGDQTLPSTAWHPEFRDVNNDGFVDLFISKGNVDEMPEYAAADPSNLLLGQADGSFVESAETAGLLSFGRSRGAALVDFNLDGMLDLVEVNRRENVKLWRNVGSGATTSPLPIGNWIQIRLEQPSANSYGIGSWVEVKAGGRTVQRELTIGGGHASGQLGWIHFGLGDADSAQVRVQWPGGEFGPWQRIEANSFALIDRNASDVLIWTPNA